MSLRLFRALAVLVCSEPKVASATCNASWATGSASAYFPCFWSCSTWALNSFHFVSCADTKPTIEPVSRSTRPPCANLGRQCIENTSHTLKRKPWRGTRGGQDLRRLYSRWSLPARQEL